MRDEILKLISKRGGVSFVELERINGFKGDYNWCIKNNIFLWNEMSHEAVLAILGLINSKEIVMKASVPLVYMHDGATINLPIAKKLNFNYKTKRWFPVVFWTPKQLGVK